MTTSMNTKMRPLVEVVNTVKKICMYTFFEVHGYIYTIILDLTSVPFRPTTVQVPNLTPTLHETDNSV